MDKDMNKDINTIMSEDDFVYYTNEKNETKSGGFTLHSLGLKNGLSPFSGGSDSGGGVINDTEFSQQFKNLIVPSFLHYQLAGDQEDQLSSLLITYDTNNQEQSGGDLLDNLMNFDEFLDKNNFIKIKKTRKMTKKNRILKNDNNIKNTNHIKKINNTKKNRN